MIFEYEKNGLLFKFRNAKLNDNKMTFEYKIIGQENNTNDGYFYNAEFEEKIKAIKVNFNYQNKKYKYIGLEEKIFNDINDYYNQLLEEKKTEIENISNKIINGDILINFTIIGCYYLHYKPSIKLKSNIKEWDILLYTINKYIKKSEVVYDPYRYLSSNIEISEKENLPKGAANIKLNKENSIVTSFDMKLSDIIDIKKINKNIEEKEKAKAKLQEFKNSIYMKITKHGVDNKEPFAYVTMRNKAGEELQFICRNIFDFGYVINPDYFVSADGVVENNGYWQNFDAKKGWYNVRELTSFEKECIKYLNKFPPIYSNIIV